MSVRRWDNWRVWVDVDVCVAGGGPAGMMLALLLAREGVSVAVLEKHADFLRDFRGDTVHPSTLTVMDQLGLGEATAEAPHRDLADLEVTSAGRSYRIADFRRLRHRHPYIRFMPQWNFLSILAEAGNSLQNFHLLTRHEVTDVLWRDGAVRGVRAQTKNGSVEIRARLTVAADGRDSHVRELSGLPVRHYGAPMDVLWFRLDAERGDAAGLDMYLGPGRVLLAIDRGTYTQVAFVVAKGDDQRWRQRPIQDLQNSVAELAPRLGPHVSDLDDWSAVHTLTVQLNRLRRWYAPGLLCIGDAAHAMSPIGGVGINLAIQDAVCAARLLTEPLRDGNLDTAALASIQRRRQFPTAGTQLIQRVAQRRVVGPVLASSRTAHVPVAMRILSGFPILQGIPARLIGIGIRPEDVPVQSAHDS